MWELVTAVPRLHKALAVLFALINVILAGWCTMFAACFATMDETVSKSQITVGLVQFLTSFAIVGWLASIYWGYLLIREAWKEEGSQKLEMDNSHL